MIISMEYEAELKKDNIQVVGTLDTLSVNTISNFVARKLSSKFPYLNLKYNDLFAIMSHTPMYIAKMPEGMSDASYFYKNSSLYFKEGTDLNKLQDLAIHEFIHHLQERKNRKNQLTRLGLASFTDFKIYGMAFNEAAVQLMTSRALNSKFDTVKYYGITLSTISPTYYPLICNLVHQMAYLAGEKLLFSSTLNCTDNFKNKFIDLCGKSNFYKIQKNLDLISIAEEKLVSLNNKLESNDMSMNKAQLIGKLISYNKEKITSLFISTQNLIITSYFNRQYKELNSTAEVEYFRKKLYNYKGLLGTVEGYNFYNDYYINMMTKLDGKFEDTTSFVESLFLVPVKESKWIKAINKIRVLSNATKERIIDMIKR